MNDQEIDSLSAARSAIEAPSDKSLRVPCYCEENVWRLAYRKLHSDDTVPTPSYHVAFVTNPKGCIPMFEQLAAEDRESPVFWDYHVILFMTTKETKTMPRTTYVLDIDSHLSYPCPLNLYVEMVFANHSEWPEEYQPYFRVIDSAVFLRHFSSDRTHMYDKETKTWSAPPPTYDCILSPRVKAKLSDEVVNTTFKQYSTISTQQINQSEQPNGEDQPFGKIYSLSKLVRRFRVGRNPTDG